MNTLHDIELVEKIPVEDGYALRGTRSGRVFSHVSENYCLVQNRDILLPFLDRFGAKSVRKLIGLAGGKTLITEFETGEDVQIGGEVLRQRLLITNSYDKSRAFSFILGAFRTYCGNGLYNGAAELAAKRVHIGNIKVNAAIEEVFASYGDKKKFDHWRRMAETPVTPEKEKEFIETFQPYDLKDDQRTENYYRTKNVRRLATAFEAASRLRESDTVWGLYNKLNWSISRVIRTRDLRELVKVNRRLEAHALNFFSLN